MTDEDIAKVAALLKQLEPGFLPYDVFIQIARLSVLSIIELVPLRSNHGRIEVLLLERSPDDPIWPGKLHSPGTVVRPTDRSLPGEPVKRIISDELNGTKLSNQQFVKSLFYDTDRGKENASVFWAEVLGEPKAGKFYQLDNLPDNLITFQKDFIEAAAEKFGCLL
jgi:hypothetical protein